MLDTPEHKTKTSTIRSKIQEKCILLGILPAPGADSFSADKGHLSEEEKRARQELLGFAHQRRVQLHR